MAGWLAGWLTGWQRSDHVSCMLDNLRGVARLHGIGRASVEALWEGVASNIVGTPKISTIRRFNDFRKLSARIFETWLDFEDSKIQRFLKSLVGDLRNLAKVRRFQDVAAKFRGIFESSESIHVSKIQRFL